MTHRRDSLSVTGFGGVGRAASIPVMGSIPPRWREVMLRYRVPTELRTTDQQKPFTVVTDDKGDLRITPHSSGKPRTLKQTEFERALPLIGTSAAQSATQNSSYIEAIVDDLRRG